MTMSDEHESRRTPAALATRFIAHRSSFIAHISIARISIVHISINRSPRAV
jgi:hypothetical protein